MILFQLSNKRLLQVAKGGNVIYVLINSNLLYSLKKN